MNGPIAQIVALTIHSNAALAGRPHPRFFPDNSTCTFCDEIEFAELEKSLLGSVTERRIAASPNEWFLYLLKRGVGEVRLLRKAQNDPRISDRMSAGFVGGGGTWMIEALFVAGRSEFWAAGWKVWNQQALEQRIWRVTYARVDEGTTTASPTADLTRLMPRFTKALQAIRDFSVKHKCDPFTGSFEHALDTLTTHGGTRHGFHSDLSPDGFLPGNALMALDAAQSAYVFGGMGSWNDMGFKNETQREYERVSDDLFDVVNDVIVAATNTFKRT